MKRPELAPPGVLGGGATEIKGTQDQRLEKKS